MKNAKYGCGKCGGKFSDKDLLELMIVSGQCPMDGTELEEIQK